MIKCKNSVVRLEGKPEEYCCDFQYISRALYETFTKELKMPEEDARSLIIEAAEDGFMPKEELLKKAADEINDVYREFCMDLINVLQKEVEKHEKY